MAWRWDINVELAFVISYLGSSDLWGGRSQNCDLGCPCYYVGDPSTRVVSATASLILVKRRLARFQRSNSEGSTASWAADIIGEKDRREEKTVETEL
jgi:hypothetical protein